MAPTKLHYFALKACIQHLPQLGGTRTDPNHEIWVEAIWVWEEGADRCLSKGVSQKIVICEQHGSGAARLEEVFFDSQVWLDSDVEDFYSVNGDFTPSCGNTPIHPSSVVRSPERLDAEKNLDIAPVASPSDGKKRLSELFGDEIGKNINNNDRVMQESYSNANRIQKPEPELGQVSSQKSVTGSPYASVSSSICSSTERTPTKGLKSSKYKSGCSSPCCLPSLARSLSFGAKKKRLVPAHA